MGRTARSVPLGHERAISGPGPAGRRGVVEQGLEPAPRVVGELDTRPAARRAVAAAQRPADVDPQHSGRTAALDGDRQDHRHARATPPEPAGRAAPARPERRRGAATGTTPPRPHRPAGARPPRPGARARHRPAAAQVATGSTSGTPDEAHGTDRARSPRATTAASWDSDARRSLATSSAGPSAGRCGAPPIDDGPPQPRPRRPATACDVAVEAPRVDGVGPGEASLHHLPPRA